MMFATTAWAEISGINHAFVAQARGVFWDRAAWAWRASDGAGNESTHPTWSDANAWLDGAARPCFTITWDPVSYAPDGTPVSLSTLFGYGEGKSPKAPRKRRKGKRK